MRFGLPLVLALCLSPSFLWAESLDRQVAEWVLQLGGSVGLENQSGRVRDVTRLPDEDFALELIDLVGTNIFPPDLERLVGLQHLRVLNLPGPMWNPRADGST